MCLNDVRAQMVWRMTMVVHLYQIIFDPHLCEKNRIINLMKMVGKLFSKDLKDPLDKEN